MKQRVTEKKPGEIGEKMKKLFLHIVLTVLFTVTGFAAGTAPVMKQPTNELRGIAALAISCFARQHYNGTPLNARKCDLAFQEYLQSLDPAKMYLTDEDVQEFLSGRENFPRMFASGDLQLPFGIFNLVHSRQRLYAEFAKHQIAHVVLDGNDTIQLDRKKAPRAKNVKELFELWKKKLTNDLILIHLSDRAIAREIEERKAKGDTKDLPEIPKTTPQERLLKRIDQTIRYYAGMEPIDVLEIFLNAVAAAYDPHTAYLTPVSDEDFNISMSLKLFGIGAVLTSEDGYTKIVEVIPGGPAAKDGRLQPGDRISAVAQAGKDAEDIINMPLNKVVRRIRGPVGTDVILTVLPAKNGGVNAVPVKIRLTRAEVVVKDSEATGEVRTIRSASGKDRKLGVISLPSFYMDFDAARKGDPNYKCASRDVRKILEDFKKQGVDGVVVDLRSNGGGSLPDAVALSGLFIKSGPVVQVRTPSEVESYDDPDKGEIVYDGPLVVLVNRLSASASEIFAGVIRDYNRGIVVGDSKTHGKGTVQNMNSLDPLIVYLLGRRIKAGSIKITCAKFYRVNGESTQLKGVVPDIVFPSFFDTMDMGEDKLDNPLEWDKIAPVVSGKDGLPLDRILPSLREKSAARVAASADFNLLKKDIERFEKIQAEKNVPLNLEIRWKKYLEEKKIADEQAKLFKLEDRTTQKKDKKKDDQKDLYLDETLNILNDLIESPAA